MAGRLRTEEEDSIMGESPAFSRDDSPDPLAIRRAGKRPAGSATIDRLEQFLQEHEAQMAGLSAAGKTIWDQLRRTQEKVQAEKRISNIAAQAVKSNLDQLASMFRELAESQEYEKQQAAAISAMEREALEAAHLRTQRQLLDTQMEIEKLREQAKQSVGEVIENQKLQARGHKEQMAEMQRQIDLLLTAHRSNAPDPSVVPPGDLGEEEVIGGGIVPPPPPGGKGKGNDPSDDGSDSHGKRAGGRGRRWRSESPEEEKERDSLAKVPFEFDNPRKNNLRHWLLECEIYFEQRPRKFRNDKQKVLFAGTYTTGLAKEWFANYHEVHMRGPNGLDFCTWERFRQEIRGRFVSSQEALDAAFKMDHLKYQSSISDYLTKMEILNQRAQQSGAAFRKTLLTGLPEEIWDRHSKFEPADDDAHFVAQLERAGKAHESFLEQKRLLGNPSTRAPPPKKEEKRRPGFQIKGRAQEGQKTESSRPGGGSNTQGSARSSSDNKPLHSSYDEATKGIPKSILEQRRSKGECARCGRKGHLWRWCRQNPNSSAAVSALGQKRGREEEDEEMKDAPAPPPEKKKRHRTKKKSVAVAATSTLTGPAYVPELGSESEVDFDMGF